MRRENALCGAAGRIYSFAPARTHAETTFRLTSPYGRGCGELQVRRRLTRDHVRVPAGLLRDTSEASSRGFNSWRVRQLSRFLGWKCVGGGKRHLLLRRQLVFLVAFPAADRMRRRYGAFLARREHASLGPDKLSPSTSKKSLSDIELGDVWKETYGVLITPTGRMGSRTEVCCAWANTTGYHGYSPFQVVACCYSHTSTEGDIECH